MITHLELKGIINEEPKNKIFDSIFKRHHDKSTDDNERRKAQKRNALQWYYHKKLIRMWQRFQEHKEELDCIYDELVDCVCLCIDGATNNDEDDKNEQY